LTLAHTDARGAPAGVWTAMRSFRCKRGVSRRSQASRCCRWRFTTPRHAGSCLHASCATVPMATAVLTVRPAHLESRASSHTTWSVPWARELRQPRSCRRPCPRARPNPRDHRKTLPTPSPIEWSRCLSPCLPQNRWRLCPAAMAYLETQRTVLATVRQRKLSVGRRKLM